VITEDKIICKWCGHVRYVGRSDDFGEGRTLNEVCQACRHDKSDDQKLAERNRLPGWPRL